MADTVFLIGMMGCGKSFWARKISEAMPDLQWLDLDEFIEKQEACSVATLFEQKGETYFRAAETKALQLATAKGKQIIATGGGAPCFNNNMEWMNKHGITIWIDVSIDLLVSRAMKDVSHRPAIQKLNAQQVTELFMQRYTERIVYYQQAKYRLQSNQIQLANFLNIIKYHA